MAGRRTRSQRPRTRGKGVVQGSLFGGTRSVNLKDEEPDVYAGRPKGGRAPQDIPIGEDGWLGNPYDVREHSDALKAFKRYFLERVETDPAFRDAVLALRDKRLGCFCKPKDCHADIIAAWIDRNP